MKYSLLTLIFFGTISISFSQSAVPNNIRATNTLERLGGISKTDMLYGIPMPPGKVIGDTYLDMHWKNSSILLYEKDKLLEGYPVRYDIHSDELEINAKNGIKVLKGSKVKSFVWADSITNTPTYFVNAKEYKSDNNTNLGGFFQVVSDGAMPLFKKTTVEIKKADYNVAFNVGSHDDKILKKSDFYTLKGNEVVEIPGSKKKFLPLFGDKTEVIEKFIRDNGLSISKEENLKMIFDHYNSLVNN